MIPRKLICVFLFAALLGGCSIHPLPEDATQLRSEDILKVFRCGMRDALLRRAVNAVGRPGRERDQDIGEKLGKGKISFSEARRLVRTPDLKEVLDRYAGATILYDFNLQMTENNDASGAAGIARPFAGGSDTIGFSIVSNHQRQNVITFTSRDIFERLMDGLPEGYCAEIPTNPNYDYPISGTTKLDQVAISFLNLNQSGNLVGPRDSKDSANTPSIAHELTFTTKKSAGLTPGFTYNVLGRVFELASASGTFATGREDVHRVTLVLALPSPGSKPTPRTLAESDQAARDRLQQSRLDSDRLTLQSIGNSLSRRGLFIP